MIVTPSGHGMGWRAQRPDVRDRKLRLVPPTVFPASFTMRPDCPPVYDQGQAGSCVWNWLAFAYEFDLAKQKLPAYVISRLFGYYLTRQLEHTESVDAGCVLRDAIKVLASVGDVPETSWPYDLSKLLVAPPPDLVAQADANRALLYAAVDQGREAVKTALLSGFPVGVGIAVYESFESTLTQNTGNVVLPAPGERDLGGHAVAVVGYDDAKQCYEVRNSWGASWGDHGYFWLPFAYLENPDLASDLWTVSSVLP